MSYTVGRRKPRTLRVVCAGLIALVPVCRAALAAGCDSNMAAVPAVDQATLQIRGQTPVRRTLTAGADSELMVFATERGVDVTLEVTDPAGRVLGRADNPVRRTGVQRVLLATRKGEKYTVASSGKDHGDSNGSVEIRVVDLRRATDSVCADAQKTLARADTAYAAGQAVTRAVAGATGGDSGKSYQEAASRYREVVLAIQPAGSSALLAQTQLAIAALFNFDLDNFADAQTWALQASGTFASLGDTYDSARAEAIAGAAAVDFSSTVRRSGTVDATQQASTILAGARARLAKVVAFHAGRQELFDQAWAQNNIGVAFYYEGRYDEAIKAYRKALAPYEKLHERTRQAQVLQNMALVEYELGRASDSLPHFEQAVSLIRRVGNPKMVTEFLANSALAHLDTGNEDLALRELAESLTLARTIQDTGQQAVDLHNIALVYSKMGDQSRALDFYRQALTSFTNIEYVRGQTSVMRAMGNILRQQGHAEEALKMDRETLTLVATSWARPRVLVQMAQDLIMLGRPKEAAEALEKVLNRDSGSDAVVRARALQERARLEMADGDLEAAQADLKSALTTFKSYELTLDEFSATITQAQLLNRRGATQEAFATIDEALSLAEEVRLRSANPELRSTLLQPLRPAFDLKISMLAQQYSQATGNKSQQALLAMRALETAEQARARSLIDYQALDVTAPGLDPLLLERRKTLYKELSAHRSKLEDRIEQTGTVDSQGQAIRSEIAILRQELDQIDAKIGAASGVAVSRRTQTLKSTPLRTSAIPRDVAIVEYWLGDTSSFAWVVSSSGVTMTPLGESARISAAATALHTALRSFGTVSRSERLAASERLYRLVLKPVESQFSTNRTLIFAPDGALHYVPFATLRSGDAGGESFLVEKHDIAVTPSIQMFLTPSASRPVAEVARRMLLVDDPVYDRRDPRVARSAARQSGVPGLPAQEPSLALVRGAGTGGYLPRLPGAAREAAEIAALMPAGSVDRLDGFAANREKFLASGLDRYRLIHVASHATTDPEIPQASALILSTVDTAGNPIDGRVLGADFLSVRLHADTVVLSACDTALGKSVAGEGLMGLQYAVLARGARSVVSSLWPAMDQVTAQVMVEFYSALLRRHSTIISAWSAASREALRGTYSDPGTWGAFMLTLSHVEDLNTN